jgi:ubiquinone/menaquinone biosynthesis C-methylase UbiE
MEQVINKLKTLDINDKSIKGLDVGTGSGQFVHVLRESFPNASQIVGIDLEEKYIERIKQHFEEEYITFMAMNGEAMTFEDESFDIVCLSNTLHHLPNQEAVLKEMNRVCRKGGYIVFNEMISDQNDEKQMTHVWLHHFAAELDMATGVHHDKTYTKEALSRLIDEIGLEKVISEDYVVEVGEDGQQIIDHFAKAIMSRLDQMEDKEKADELRQTFESQKDELYQAGFSLATEVLTILKK